MEIEKRIEVIREAQSKVKGDITIWQYRENYKEFGWPPIKTLLDGIKWNYLKDQAFEKKYRVKQEWSLEDALENYKKACNYYNKENLTTTYYFEYTQKYGGPSLSFILARLKWNDFKSKYRGENIKLKKEKNNHEFCDNCLEKEGCDIELENCEYWREWNENQRKSFG